VGCEIPDEDETTTPVQAYICNATTKHWIFFTLPWVPKNLTRLKMFPPQRMLGIHSK
jgi:hypothetical protein